MSDGKKDDEKKSEDKDLPKVKEEKAVVAATPAPVTPVRPARARPSVLSPAQLAPLRHDALEGLRQSGLTPATEQTLKQIETTLRVRARGWSFKWTTEWGNAVESVMQDHKNAKRVMKDVSDFIARREQDWIEYAQVLHRQLAEAEQRAIDAEDSLNDLTTQLEQLTTRARNRAGPTLPQFPALESPDGQKNYEAVLALVKTCSKLDGRSIEEANKALLARVAAAGLAIRHVRKDGNCMMDSLADQLFLQGVFVGDWNDAKVCEQASATVRAKTSQYLAAHDELHAFLTPGYTPERMAQDGQWGDHVMLRCAAEVYQRRIIVISSAPTRELWEIVPEAAEARVNADRSAPLYLCHWSELHFGSLAPKPT